MNESLVVYPADDLLEKHEELRLYFIFYYEESRAFVCINGVPHHVDVMPSPRPWHLYRKARAFSLSSPDLRDGELCEQEKASGE